jgi:hypothetical protein
MVAKHPSRRELFKPADDGRNVVLNFTGRPKQELGLQGEAYHRAGKLLVNDFKSQKAYSDLDAYPIVFLYRHALELLFKAVLTLGNGLAAALPEPALKTENLYTDHALVRHLPRMKQIFEAVGWNDAWEQAGFKEDEFEAIVAEFERVDPGSFTFRYTMRKDGTASIDSHFTFAPEEFAEKLDRVLEILSGACSGLEEYLDLAWEYDAENSQYRE